MNINEVDKIARLSVLKNIEENAMLSKVCSWHGNNLSYAECNDVINNSFN